jgi:hypothetical protein
MPPTTDSADPPETTKAISSEQITKATVSATQSTRFRKDSARIGACLQHRSKWLLGRLIDSIMAKTDLVIGSKTQLAKLL